MEAGKDELETQGEIVRVKGYYNGEESTSPVRRKEDM